MGLDPEALSGAINEQLRLYGQEALEAVGQLGEKAVQDLVTKTKATAPEGHRRGKFKRHIAWKLLKQTLYGRVYVWYVKAPDYRLTHLLVHGHATRNGGRTRADPFLSNALAEVLPAFENGVKEALKR